MATLIPSKQQVLGEREFREKCSSLGWRHSDEILKNIPTLSTYALLWGLFDQDGWPWDLKYDLLREVERRKKRRPKFTLEMSFHTSRCDSATWTAQGRSWKSLWRELTSYAVEHPKERDSAGKEKHPHAAWMDNYIYGGFCNKILVGVMALSPGQDERGNWKFPEGYAKDNFEKAIRDTFLPLMENQGLSIRFYVSKEAYN